MQNALQKSPAPQSNVALRDMANAIRALSMDAVEKAKSGHPGMPMGMADVATVLFTEFLKVDPSCPTWPDRDRFILSGGHGSMLLYSTSYLLGYEAMTMDQIKNFRQLGALTAGHPERMPEIGAEMTTGPLGQGIATSVGFAIAERNLNAKFGDELVSHKTYVMAGDGDLMEGISQEAISMAGHLRLNNLVVLYDDNGISIDGSTDLSFTDDTVMRFTSCGWATKRIDGHHFDEIRDALQWAQTQTKPVMIACRTTIGFGAPKKAGTSGCHGSPLGAEEIAGAREALNWPHAPFEIPSEILDAWRAAGTRNTAARKAWEAKATPEFKAAWNGDALANVNAAIQSLKADFVARALNTATRASSGFVLDKLVDVLPNMLGGSADLTGSNNTYKKGNPILSSNNYGGQYIYYGVREHGMAAAMNGIVLHGGCQAYGGTFLSFADYCRPSIRLAALMKINPVFVMTHDSIGLGEDGPTHQPVEHVASLRAIPNLNVFRPCDAVEAAESWQVALSTAATPSVLALTRQNLPLLRQAEAENRTAKGAYVLSETHGGAPDIVLIATGSEVSIAHDAMKAIESTGKRVRLVSMPCMDLFLQQDDAYRSTVLGTAKRIVVEAAIRMGWDRFLRPGDVFIGMSTFGESAPAPELYAHFGITAEAIAKAAE